MKDVRCAVRQANRQEYTFSHVLISNFSFASHGWFCGQETCTIFKAYKNSNQQWCYRRIHPDPNPIQLNALILHFAHVFEMKRTRIIFLRFHGNYYEPEIIVFHRVCRIHIFYNLYAKDHALCIFKNRNRKKSGR